MRHTKLNLTNTAAVCKYIKEQFLYDSTSHSANYNVLRLIFSNLDTKLYKVDLYNEFKKDLIVTETLEELTASIDNIFIHTDRKQKGEFYTSKCIVNKAYEYIEEEFGEDWREKYIVWDLAAGSCNLTRDYVFKKLYISTLEEEDIVFSNEMGYNPEAVKFQFDFLNDDFDKLPKELMESIVNGEKMIILVNPPYKCYKVECKYKEELIKRKYDEKLNKASCELYWLFLYRIMDLCQINDNISLALVCKFNMYNAKLTLGARNNFLKVLEYRRGFKGSAHHFDGLKSKWTYIFNIFRHNKSRELNLRLDMDTVELINNKLEVIKNEIVELPFDNNRGSILEYLKSSMDLPKDRRDLKITLPLKDAYTMGDRMDRVSYVLPNQIGNYKVVNRVIGGMDKDNFIRTGGNGGSRALPIYKENLLETISHCGVKLIVNKFDKKYTGYNIGVPNVNHSKYNTVVYNALVYCIFSHKFQTSHLEGLDYTDLKRDLYINTTIENHLFYIPKDTVISHLNAHSKDLINLDSVGSDYIYHLIEGNLMHLNSTAMELWALCRDLTLRSLEYRTVDEKQSYHWNSSWLQILDIVKERFPSEFGQYTKLMSKLEELLIDDIEEVGYLEY